MAKTGPKPKLTAKVKKRLLRLLRVGMSLAESITCLGVTRSMLRYARERDPEFSRGVKAASLRGKARHLFRVARGDERWQSSAWFLERKYGSEYGNKLNVDLGGGATMRLIEEIVEAPADGEAGHRNGQAPPRPAGLPS